MCRYRHQYPRLIQAGFYMTQRCLEDPKELRLTVYVKRNCAWQVRRCFIRQYVSMQLSVHHGHRSSSRASVCCCTRWTGRKAPPLPLSGRHALPLRGTQVTACKYHKLGFILCFKLSMNGKFIFTYLPTRLLIKYGRMLKCNTLSLNFSVGHLLKSSKEVFVYNKR